MSAFKDYPFSDEIDGYERLIKEIDPEFVIGCISFSDDELKYVVMSLPLKGNKDKINKLKALGWEEYGRELKSEDSIWRRQRVTGFMIQSMILRM